jgi:hypothetical protein
MIGRLSSSYGTIGRSVFSYGLSLLSRIASERVAQPPINSADNTRAIVPDVPRMMFFHPAPPAEEEKAGSGGEEGAPDPACLLAQSIRGQGIHVMHLT